MFSHMAAFTILYGLKLEFTRHIASLPLGFHSENSTGKIRKAVDEILIQEALSRLAASKALVVIARRIRIMSFHGASASRRFDGVLNQTFE
jgi:ABC-type transport system involved in Fe-S cluster assembly fused permease/ATPase subunit